MLQRMLVLGMKKFVGEVGEGSDKQHYDTTTIFVQMRQDESKGTAKGFVGQDFKFGDSKNYDRFQHLKFPLEVDIELDTTSNGKGGMKTFVVDLKPVQSPAPAKA